MQENGQLSLKSHPLWVTLDQNSIYLGFPSWVPSWVPSWFPSWFPSWVPKINPIIL